MCVMYLIHHKNHLFKPFFHQKHSKQKEFWLTIVENSCNVNIDVGVAFVVGSKLKINVAKINQCVSSLLNTLL